MTKLDDDRFWVVASDTAHRHVADLAAPAHRATRTPFVTDVTSGYAQLNVQGPRSRELLQPLTSADLSNEAFPFRTAREIDLGFARVLCIRITYLGELGYELYIPAEQAVHVYDRLVAAGAGVRAAPRRAQGAGQPADGEGLPRLRPRHRQHRHRCSRPGSASRSRSTSRAASSAATRSLAQKARGSADAAPGPGAGDRPRAAAVPRRGRPPRRQRRSATSAPRPTATPSAARSAWRWSRPASRVDQA